MPGRDGTGPRGMGPMTGGGFGPCAGYGTFGYGNRAIGVGFGRGGGRGYRNWFYATGQPGWVRAGYAPAWGMGPVGAPTAEQEAEALRRQAEVLNEQLSAINARIGELEKKE